MSQKIKCLVWDLDNTLWDGVLLEDDHVTLREGVIDVIRELDSRGVLHSIASKNDHATAMAKLQELGLESYFLYPQINWSAKSSSIAAIAEAINIGIDTLAFIDDQVFEREEVLHEHPEVLCLDAMELMALLEYDSFKPRFITPDSQLRRQMYLSDMERNTIETDFKGPKDSFLASLEMKFSIASAQPEDLQRAEELTVRTNQLNTTGYTYSYEELAEFCHSDRYQLLIAGLTDKYGTYGKIGLVLLDCSEKVWTIKLLLMSCRVMSRGIGAVLVNYLRNQAREHDVKLMAEWVGTDRNRMMYMTYKFNYFQDTSNPQLLENDLTVFVPYPDYVQLELLPIQWCGNTTL